MKNIKKEDTNDAITVFCLICLGILIILNAMAYTNKLDNLETQYEEQTEILKKNNEDLKNQVQLIEFEYDAEIASLTNAIKEVNDKANNKIKDGESGREGVDLYENNNASCLTLQNTETTEEVPPIVAAATRDDYGEDTYSPSIITEETYDKFIEVDEEELVEEQEVVQEDTKAYYYYGTKELTAYCATGNACADGVYPSAGYTVASNDKNLWHKWVYIEGIGDRYVHDTGSMSVNVIDIYMDSYNECIMFGRQSADIYVYY